MLGSYGGNPIASLYPHPPQPQQNALLSNPLGAMQQINALKAFNAQQAVGRAFQGALNPDGSMDVNKLSAGLQDPSAALAAPEGISTMLAQRGQQISNATNQFNLAAGQNNSIVSTLGALADSNPIIDDVRSYATTLARNTNIPSSTINGWLQGLSSDPATLKQQLLTFRNTALGSQGVSGRAQGPVSPEGAPTTISTGQANIASGAPQGGIATSLPPGQAEALATNQAAYVQDQQRSAATLANVRRLETAFPLISQLSASNFGPGSNGLSQLKGALTFAGILPADSTSLPTRQDVNKYLHQYAEGAINAGRSDAALSAALAANPNLDLTKPANLALVKNQVGFDKMDAAIPLSTPSKAQYLDYKSGYYQSNDPRAFSFNMDSPQERRQIIDSLGPPSSSAYKKFIHSLNLATQTKMVTPDASNGQQQ